MVFLSLALAFGRPGEVSSKVYNAIRSLGFEATSQERAGEVTGALRREAGGYPGG